MKSVFAALVEPNFSNETMYTLEEMGKRAYFKQMWGAYEQAVKIYSDAIKRHPNDSRLFNNRCMCFNELKDYKRALEDAESMVLMFSRNKKAFFRKGEVLMNMKKYSEAEEAFKEVLKIDPTCGEALNQLFEVQCLELCERGKYPKDKVKDALRMSHSKEEAERLIKSGELDAINKELEDIVYFSDEENISERGEPDPLMDPNNPLQCTTLWVGNLTNFVTETTLKNLFSKYGRIKSVKTQLQYAFVNYHDAVGPGKAMKALQGAPLGGKNLKLKYPDNAFNLTKKSGKPK